MLHDEHKLDSKQKKDKSPGGNSQEDLYPGGAFKSRGDHFVFVKPDLPGGESKNACFQTEKVMRGGKLRGLRYMPLLSSLVTRTILVLQLV